jgi:hypothetical protein
MPVAMLIMLVDDDGRLSGRDLMSVAIVGPSGMGSPPS